MIQYNCNHLSKDQSCSKVRSELRKVFKLARNEIDRKIILAPYTKMPRLIAVTAWNRLQYFDKIEEEERLSFTKALINEGPEYMP